MVDTRDTNNFITLEKAKCLALRITNGGGGFKTVHTIAKPFVGMAKGVHSRLA